MIGMEYSISSYSLSAPDYDWNTFCTAELDRDRAGCSSFLLAGALGVCLSLVGRRTIYVPTYSLAIGRTGASPQPPYKATLETATCISGFLLIKACSLAEMNTTSSV